MRAYLFGWNPVKWEWKDIDDDIAQLKAEGKLEEAWSVASHKTIRPGDRAYVIRLGAEPKGIFASGYISSEPYLTMHNGRQRYRINIEFDVMINPDKQSILALSRLKTGNFMNQNWTPQASGISIKPYLVDELESIWLNFLDTQKIIEI